ncbi:excinuclease ABC subunit UvrB [Myxococcota bacterium]|nr:excinuclease ABC subunit UvrB [Myxococcota bacterium]
MKINDDAPRPFELVSPLSPCGDQPQAIAALSQGVAEGEPHQVLLGVTGSGKTFTIAHVIAASQRPTLILAHNKTLAAQLYGELKGLFPHNAVEYFVSYYDYYQPEAYVPQTDTFVEKDARINEEIDRMRHSATRALLTRRDVIIVASISCIYGLGDVSAYDDQHLRLEVGQTIERDAVMRKLVEIQYTRNDIDFHRGTFRARGDTLEVFPIHEAALSLRISFFGDEIEAIHEVDPLRGKTLRVIREAHVYPASHYAVRAEQLKGALAAIREELAQRLAELNAAGKLIEAQRLAQRTQFDLEQLEEIGVCQGIENYARHLSGRAAGLPPECLLDYFPKDWLLVIDESHVTVPQIGGMYRGDLSRKQTLIDYGFRLPSAVDNRPLKFEEFDALTNQIIYVSATPKAYELEKTMGVVVEQLIRPTGLLDPVVEVRPALTQVDDLLGELHHTIKGGWRALVTTLTKRMAEDLTEYYSGLNLKVRYLHADIDTLERTALLRDLRRGVFDVLIGINLLREGLDLPEVGLVAIMDADKEGFLRDRTSLIQTIGRAARNAEGRVLLYAERITGSMEAALEETARRRAAQRAYNEAHGITPQTIIKAITDLEAASEALSGEPMLDLELDLASLPGRAALEREIEAVKAEMLKLAADLRFEEAAQRRDRLKALERRLLL